MVINDLLFRKKKRQLLQRGWLSHSAASDTVNCLHPADCGRQGKGLWLEVWPVDRWEPLEEGMSEVYTVT